MRFFVLLLVLLGLTGWSAAQPPAQQSAQQPAQPPGQANPGPGPNDAPPRSQDDDRSKDRETEAGESSSRDTRGDISPPKNDVKDHPNSGASDTNPEDDTGDVSELHPWNPYRAIKDDEVGDFYFKRKSYKAALARYQDALIYKDKDAVANFRMAECYEKLNQPNDAITHYQEYLKILPEGPFAKDAKKALERLEKRQAANR
jgi:tetratricopeptide (TPR) repeat protein